MIELQAGVLVTLGGCHLLDGLVARDSVKHTEWIVRCSGEELCERLVFTSRGSRRATILERVIELPHLRVVSCAREWRGGGSPNKNHRGVGRHNEE